MINNEISKGKFAILIGSLLELEESGRCGCICGDGGSDRNVQPSDFICEALGVEMCSIIKTLPWRRVLTVEIRRLQQPL